MDSGTSLGIKLSSNGLPEPKQKKTLFPTGSLLRRARLPAPSAPPPPSRPNQTRVRPTSQNQRPSRPGSPTRTNHATSAATPAAPTSAR
ncbi:hypothetical protein HPP92_018681 [Vanilla planifolia]|uniref:Uncharacterized protein n=1 Tax=Vanilla planifolia TaxID=51239 RepID=A0A835QIK1_VANPL|nr:hypothetical protein HPP92_018681 [Vanilla planifolia]